MTVEQDAVPQTLLPALALLNPTDPADELI
jgi:hypothetical protein